MKLYHLTTGLLGVNTYFLVNENTAKAVVIDSGENYKTITKTAKELGVQITHLFLTHAHFDHAGTAGKLQQDGVLVYISEIDAPKLSNHLNLAGSFGRKFDNLTPDYTFVDGQEIIVNQIKIKVILTPGHTDGSATFLVEDMLFTGDTLFYLSVGRTDFPTGDKLELENSIKKLYSINGDLRVFPGHGQFTTLEHERKFNQFIDYD